MKEKWVVLIILCLGIWIGYLLTTLYKSNEHFIGYKKGYDDGIFSKVSSEIAQLNNIPSKETVSITIPSSWTILYDKKGENKITIPPGVTLNIQGELWLKQDYDKAVLSANDKH